jgi:hypothetical protein
MDELIMLLLWVERVLDESAAIIVCKICSTLPKVFAPSSSSWIHTIIMSWTVYNKKSFMWQVSR